VNGRFLLESVVSAHKIIHDAIKKKDKGLVLKLDYEKAYDKIDGQFLEDLDLSGGARS
jgi:hypothetical protein